MAEMGTEFKIWMLTGSGDLVFGAESGFGVNFSDSAHLLTPTWIGFNLFACLFVPSLILYLPITRKRRLRCILVESTTAYELFVSKFRLVL